MAVSAATETRASCHFASAPASRAWLASRLARRPPNRSISQLDCRPAWSVVIGGIDVRPLPLPVPVPPKPLVGELPRLADALPVRFGASAAPAATRVARASAMRAPALATLGLAAWAASISSTSNGSSSWRHQSASTGSEPPWGRGVFHCAGVGAVTCSGGRGSAQADNSRGNASQSAASREFLMRNGFRKSGVAGEPIVRRWAGVQPGGPCKARSIASPRSSKALPLLQLEKPCILTKRQEFIDAERAAH